ncbi:MAG: SDR family NAD(P)-dependent oxidoreductase, partial [Rubrivivax sp.]|nr:SDR family NAD(P)-dependent oxidoreductase [Rubrivivax sp.]
MGRLDDKVVIITGAGGGIGGATARRFAAEGAKVAALDRDLAAAERTAAAIVAAGGRALALRCDITQRPEVDAAVAAAVDQLGAIDVLVNNAGWDVFAPFLKTQPEQWERLIAINLTGALHLHHAVLPGMVAARPSCLARRLAVSTPRPIRRRSPGPRRPGARPRVRRAVRCS